VFGHEAEEEIELPGYPHFETSIFESSISVRTRSQFQVAFLFVFVSVAGWWVCRVRARLRNKALSVRLTFALSMGFDHGM
jgi:hypothetical protein